MVRKLIATTLCLTLFLTACAGEPTSVSEEPQPIPTPSAAPVQREFTLPYYPNADLHPILGNNGANRVLVGLVYQGLFELDNSFTPHGVLCADHSVSDDGLTWTFTLEHKIFSDHTPVTADDVVFSLETARSSTLYASRLSNVVQISAPDESTVSLTLAQPNMLLPALLDIPVIRDAQDGSMPLGTGPYRFVEDSGPLRLVREDFAPDNLPAEIPLLAVEGADDLIYAFDAGLVSLSVSDPTGSNPLGYSSGYEAFDFPTTTMLFVGFQTLQGPCAEPLLRQAFSRSLDRETVTASLLNGHGAATCLPFSPRCTLWSAAHEQTGNYDPAAAEALLTQAGYVKGEDGILSRGRAALNVTFVVNTDNSFKLAVADYLAAQLQAMGVTVNLKKLAWDDYVAALESGQFDLYLGEVTLSADFDLTALLDPEGSLNYGGYNGEETTLLLSVLRQTGVGERALMSQLLVDVPFSPICFKNHSVLTQWQAVSGLNPTRQNPFYNMESLRFGAME